jgi:hypothetical protein
MKNKISIEFRTKMMGGKNNCRSQRVVAYPRCALVHCQVSSRRKTWVITTFFRCLLLSPLLLHIVLTLWKSTQYSNEKALLAVLEGRHENKGRKLCPDSQL